jgi:hypothetical protein
MKKNNDERERKKFFSTELKFLKIKIISKKENNETICLKIIIITKTKMGENIAGRIKSSESEHTARTLFSPIKRRNLKIEFLFFYFFRLKPLSLSFLLLPPSHTHTTHAIPSSISLQKEKQNWSRSLVVCFLYHKEQAECYLCVHKWKPQLSIYTCPPERKQNKKKTPFYFIIILYFLFSLSLCLCVSIRRIGPN